MAAPAKTYKASSKKASKKFKLNIELSSRYFDTAKSVGTMFESVLPDYDIEDFEFTVEEVTA